MKDIVEGDTVPLPHMDKDGLAYFVAALSESSTYLEYGCGGSTIQASKMPSIKKVISVDTSREWVDRVLGFIAQSDTRSHVDLLYVDVGEVGEWGVPTGFTRARSFWQYVVEPWRTSERLLASPDLIMVDGRFRVASFLYSVMRARMGTRILFDDYFDRPAYSVAEKCCSLTDRNGRMATFVVDKRYSEVEIVTLLLEHVTDWS